MAAPDFYFAINASFRFLHDRYGKDALIRYWRELGEKYYRKRTESWREGGCEAVALDWQAYFAGEPQADVAVRCDDTAVELDIRVCPAIKHLRDQNREIVPCFCEHCDHVCGAMAASAGFAFERTGGMGSCRQTFTRLTIHKEAR